MLNQKTANASVSGRSLAGRRPHLRPAERAITAARVIEGKVALVSLTAKSVSELCGVSSSYVDAALKLSEVERERVLLGMRPLIEPKQKPVSQYSAVQGQAMADWSSKRLTDVLEMFEHVEVDTALTREGQTDQDLA